jgi:hypothetical protein
MDQVKEFLRQAIKYRFWISVGLSLLLPVIAYAVGSGEIKRKAAEETGKIEQAAKDVKQYAQGTIPNRQYKPAVDEKREVLSKDVNASWKKLYARQAPLLTWPTSVEDRFSKWGRKWPENVDASAVQDAIVEYVNSYERFVEQVYKTFNPFDPIEGTGIVASPGQEMLLRPSKFTVEAPPELGKVWAAQERLWIQRTLLQVIADVNANAKNWDTAIVRQINLLEVGSPLAQDQISMVHDGVIEEAPAVTNPAAPAPTTTGGSSSSGAPGAESPGMMPGSGMSGMSGMMGQTGDQLFYIKTDGTQYKVLPFEMTVLVEQNRIQDFLVALENSPMAIQINDFEMAKPAQRVAKPKKGDSMFPGMFAGGSGMDYTSMMSMMMRPPAAGGQTSFGGASDARMMMMMAAYSGGGAASAVPARKGVDVRSQSRSKTREEEEKAAAKRSIVTIHDPYYNVVEVTVYGQARFYSPPPEEPPAEPSQSAATAPAPSEGTPAAPPAADAPKPTAETPPAEAPKAEEAKPKEEAPKAEAPKTQDEAPKPEAEKAKAEAPKAEAPKAEAPKTQDEAKKQ